MREVATSNAACSNADHLRVPRQQRDIVHPALADPLPSGAEHRLGDVDRDDAAMLADRLREGQGYRAGAAADFQHALAAGKPQTFQQQREAFLVSPLPEPRAGDPTRAGDRVPIVPHGLVRVRDFSGHLARSPACTLDMLLRDQKEFRV